MGAQSIRTSALCPGSCALILVSDRVAVLVMVTEAPIRALCIHMGPLWAQMTLFGTASLEKLGLVLMGK